MDSPTPIPIRLAQTLGITLSSLLGGSNITMSVFLIPRLLESPAPLLLRQWTNFFHTAKKTQPPLALIAASAYFYLAYTVRESSSRIEKGAVGGDWIKFPFYGYIVAGLLTAGIVPYTIALMAKTNNKLLGMDGAAKVLETGGESVHQLVDKWGILNLGRGLMLAVSGLLGAWIALE